MRIAVVGAGLAGLGVTYFLLKKGHHVTLFDNRWVGRGASGIPVGLCHPYAGRSGKPSKVAYEGLQLTNELIQIAEKHSGKRLADRGGLIRRGWIPAENYNDLEVREDHILIRSGMTVLMKEYVLALYDALRLELRIDEPEGFERTVYACPKKFDLPVHYVKGQVVIGRGALEKSELKAQGHLSPLGDGQVQLGSTYEHHFESEEPNKEVAVKELSAKMSAFFPEQNFEINDCKAGIRTCVKGSYLPIVKQVSEKEYVFTGLGSRGLLYHAYYGRHLANLIT